MNTYKKIENIIIAPNGDSIPDDLSNSDRQRIAQEVIDGLAEIVEVSLPTLNSKDWGAIATAFHDSPLRMAAQATANNDVWIWDGKLMEVVQFGTLWIFEDDREKALLERFQNWYNAAYKAFGGQPDLQKNLLASIPVVQATLNQSGFSGVASALQTPPSSSATPGN